MNEIIVKAYETAQRKIDELTKPADVSELRAKFEKLSKKELVEILVEKNMPRLKVTKEALAYAILGEPDCAWLTFETIAEIIKKNVPDANTNKGCMSWYQTHANEKGRTVIPRKSNKEIMALLMGTNT